MPRPVAEIVIDGAAGSFDKRYSYLIPENLIDRALAGCRVNVPFGRGNRMKQGMILKLTSCDDADGMKEIVAVIDAHPILTDEMLKMCEWMKEHIFCSYFDAINIMLPAGLSYRFEGRYEINPEFAALSLLEEEETGIFSYITQVGSANEKKLLKQFDNATEILNSLEQKQAVVKTLVPQRRLKDVARRWVAIADISLSDFNLTARQRETAELVESLGSVCVKELQYFLGVSISVIDSLIKKGVLISFEREELNPIQTVQKKPESKEINLTDEQNSAFEGLSDLLESAKGETALLYGVTGSGKTQVFLKLVDKALSMGKGAIIMVPEIALTPQMINIFSSRYGERIAVFHSAMSLGKRMNEYKRIQQGKATIAIGTRSAVFAPFSDLGLIVIDEEQEHTYKSEKSPRFHTREIARFRAAYHGGLLCLASATPSLESYSMALSGRYKLFKLSNRYGKAELPRVDIIDMRKEILSGNSSSMSRALADAISQELENKKQIILLLNRRGHNTYVSCPSCGWVSECPNCSISLTYHSANGRLMCHYCGYSEAVKKECPSCSGEHIRFIGAGTQKLEEELKLLFPYAKILRLDADSTMTRDSYSTGLSKFSAGEYDIMLGTQMVAKGLDFPNVSLVGVIGADSALYSDDYRGFERTFSLLTQVVGRAGRADSRGHAIIQTVDPSSNVIALAKMQDYDAFYNQEITSRRLMTYPPYCDICMVSSQSTDREKANTAIFNIFNNIKKNISENYSDIRLIILGPCAATIPKVNNKYSFRMIIKCRNNTRFREMLKKSVDISASKGVSIAIDINPETVI